MLGERRTSRRNRFWLVRRLSQAIISQPDRRVRILRSESLGSIEIIEKRGGRPKIGEKIGETSRAHGKGFLVFQLAQAAKQPLPLSAAASSQVDKTFHYYRNLLPRLAPESILRP